MSIETPESFVQNQLLSVNRVAGYIEKCENGWAFPYDFYIKNLRECQEAWALILDRCAYFGIKADPFTMRSGGKGFLFIGRYMKPVTWADVFS